MVPCPQGQAEKENDPLYLIVFALPQEKWIAKTKTKEPEDYKAFGIARQADTWTACGPRLSLSASDLASR